MAPHASALQVKVELDLFGRSLLGPNAFRGPITLYRARIHLAEREIRGIGEMLVFIADGGSKKLVVAQVGDVVEIGHWSITSTKPFVAPSIISPSGPITHDHHRRCRSTPYGLSRFTTR